MKQALIAKPIGMPDGDAGRKVAPGSEYWRTRPSSVGREYAEVVAVVLGEGASGGALGIGVADRLLMMENSWYCVISPEGCAAILWGDRLKAKDVATQMRFTAGELVAMGIVDGILPEPAGGAHWDPAAAIAIFRGRVVEELDKLAKSPVEELREKRLQKYLGMGVWNEAGR